MGTDEESNGELTAGERDERTVKRRTCLKLTGGALAALAVPTAAGASENETGYGADGFGEGEYGTGTTDEEQTDGGESSGDDESDDGDTSDGQPELSNAIVIDGTGDDGSSRYGVTVSGELAYDDHMTEIDDGFRWDASKSSDGRTIGLVSGGQHAYRYSGEITSLRVRGNATVRRD